MSLFLSLLPIYILGNLHCFGMCGPLVLFLGKHPFKYYYFLGRLLSFSLMGLMAAEVGLLMQGFVVSSLLSLAVGFLLMGYGMWQLFEMPSFLLAGFGTLLKPIHLVFSSLMLKEAPFAIFAFGFLTVMLPCGQTLLVFSLCALSKNAFVGGLNGFAFALLTSPSLFLAMQASALLQRYRFLEKRLFGAASFFAGAMALLRGLADAQFIPHLVLSEKWHLVLY